MSFLASLSANAQEPVKLMVCDSQRSDVDKVYLIKSMCDDMTDGAPDYKCLKLIGDNPSRSYEVFPDDSESLDSFTQEQDGSFYGKSVIREVFYTYGNIGWAPYMYEDTITEISYNQSENKIIVSGEKVGKNWFYNRLKHGKFDVLSELQTTTYDNCKELRDIRDIEL